MHDVMRTCLAVLCGLALTATGLGASPAAEEAPAAAMEKEMVLDPTTGKMVSAPEYGGTFTWGDALGAPHCDPHIHGWGPRAITLVGEKLGLGDWGADRAEISFADPYTPLRFVTGALAESWEMADPLTYLFHIREGVRWHDKAPMNGREFTAQDVVYNLHRYTGLGSGFTEPGAATPIASLPFESITASDDSTVVIKLTTPKVDLPEVLLINWWVFMLPPEVIEQHGDLTDCDNMVGTGPYMLTEWIEGSSITYSKNPDYWDHDEKYPDNRLPYIDQVNRLIMPEKATQLASLRSGRIDYIGQSGGGQLQAAQVETLQRTNPEIVVHPWAFRSETSVAFNMRHPSPFQDIRVRKAMQMAIDLESINNTYFGGFGMTKPQGIIGDGMKGFFVPFEEWPEETRKVFAYDPEGAEALLDEAGYPRGADGIRFKAVHNPAPTWDMGYQEIAVEYWGAIGVDVEIRTHEGTQLSALITDGTYEGITFMDLGNDTDPNVLLDRLTIGMVWGRTGHQDTVMDAKAKAAMAASTLEEQQRLVAEADMYMIEQHWYIWGPKVPQFEAVQPWVIGFNGEIFFGTHSPFERLWIDSALKSEMGF
ncbi:MAG: ABC transporter substrate-binding protein [Spirochaetaceae bacterium]|nr:ABC transporter substrate-binding protein [Spirochaetaceae bacterium]